MTETSAHELAKTHFCKQPGCTGEARSAIGRYSYCEHHQSERAASRAAEKAKPDLSLRRAGGYEANAKELVRAGRELDKARERATVALDAVRNAEEAYQRALRAVGLSLNGEVAE